MWNTVGDYAMDRMTKESRFDSQQGQEILSCPQGAKIGFVAHHPASYSIDTGDCSTKGKDVGAQSWTLTTNQCRSKSMKRRPLPLICRKPSRCVAQLRAGILPLYITLTFITIFITARKQSLSVTRSIALKSCFRRISIYPSTPRSSNGFFSSGFPPKILN